LKIFKLKIDTLNLLLQVILQESILLRLHKTNWKLIENDNNMAIWNSHQIFKINKIISINQIKQVVCSLSIVFLIKERKLKLNQLLEIYKIILLFFLTIHLLMMQIQLLHQNSLVLHKIKDNNHKDDILLLKIHNREIQKVDLGQM
jgi:hypothetical protein